MYKVYIINVYINNMITSCIQMVNESSNLLPNFHFSLTFFVKTKFKKTTTTTNYVNALCANKNIVDSKIIKTRLPN